MNKLYIKLAVLAVVAVSCASINAAEDGANSNQPTPPTYFSWTNLAAGWLSSAPQGSWTQTFAQAAVVVAPKIDETIKKSQRKEEIEVHIAQIAAEIQALLPQEEAKRAELMGQAEALLEDLNEVAGEAIKNEAWKGLKALMPIAYNTVTSYVPQEKILEFVAQAMEDGSGSPAQKDDQEGVVDYDQL